MMTTKVFQRVSAIFLVVAAIFLANGLNNVANAERVLACRYRDSRKDIIHYYIETSEIQKGILCYISKNNQSIPQYCVFVPIERIVEETGKKYPNVWYIFFKNKNGEWFHSTMQEKNLDKSTGMLFHKHFWLGSKGFRLNVTAITPYIFNKANEYFDFNSIENTDANKEGALDGVILP